MLLTTAELPSSNLNRTVKLTILKPVRATRDRGLSVLLIFDGQDFPAVRVEKALGDFLKSKPDEPVLVVGIHANKDRIYEYGTASQPDYAYRGNKAANTTHFVVEELIPFLKTRYVLSNDRHCWAIAGFSLSGLMALDIAWHHSEVFSKVGVFSGSFWWRQRALDDDYAESDRIMHNIIRRTPGQPPLEFWFQTGTRDEEADRDHDGIIDSIDDTLDLIAELERKGYVWNRDVIYEEVLDGEHDPKTWSQVFPKFFRWAMR